MTQQLVKYEAARKALAAANRVDEVKDIRDKAMAMQLYARQAKDGDLIARATEIRKRAERRLGELMAESPKTAEPETTSGFQKTRRSADARRPGRRQEPRRSRPQGGSDAGG
jgi:hypothetical protein